MEEATFFGNAKDGTKNGYSVVEMTTTNTEDTTKKKEVWIANFVDGVWLPKNSKVSVLFLDDTAHGWIQHKFNSLKKDVVIVYCENELNIYI